MRSGSEATSTRARRALERQLAYQQRKSYTIAGREPEYIQGMRQRSAAVRSALELVRPLKSDAWILEVGSGAHGLVFFFGSPNAVGCDPLAAEYVTLFPAWQRAVRTIAAKGEQLPFADSTFDVVLCDNVVDHAQDPEGIVAELSRVLAPGGLLYFTVNVHHRLYDLASRLHSAWNAAGLRLEIGPFADHTVHLTPERAHGLFVGRSFRPVVERSNVAAARARARTTKPRHMGDLLKRLFFKNALFELIAVRTD